jgi:hypothetical protein
MPRRKPPEQTQIPGTERKVAPEIEAITVELVTARAEKKDAKEAEDGATERLVEAMRKLGIEVYKFHEADGTEVTVRVKAAKTKITVKKARPAAADHDGGGGGESN